MSFETFADFLAMGNHGVYVWSSYVITLVVLLWNVVAPGVAMKKEMAKLKSQWRREENDASGT